MPTFDRFDVVSVPFPYTDWPVYVLNDNLAGVGEADVDTAADAFVDDRRDTDPTGRSERLQPCRHVDSVAVDVVTIDDDVAEVDTDPEHDTCRRGFALHGALDIESAPDRVNDTAELHQRTVADQLDDAPLVSGDSGIEDLFPVPLQSRQRASLVATHHAGIADNISRENCREPPVHLVFGHTRVVWDICQPRHRSDRCGMLEKGRADAPSLTSRWRAS